ncbi:hypothetical protein IAQ61_001646 [Plenodomus lingam]|uniref:Uncharacterized protein n=1 Tax=Leptosphaeria maculans (strain JN3 / isolate v23.1.3 / race Av1-4-5-6-7-8) TaxID=985895 RepID=M1Z7N0_LEPMJ|nr:hypothetical protein IAQ61_001646 [Plenodomus lingam]CCT61091.1 hypothetical protein [Plenodomus lingam JN3]
MSGHREEELPSTPPRRGSHASAGDEETDTSYDSDHSSKFSHLAKSPRTGMPDPARNQYSNKESAKVNAGFDMGAQDQDEMQEDESKNVASAFASNMPAVDIDFSQLIVPIVAPAPASTAEQLVQRLLNPPPHAFLYGVLSMQWAIGAVGQLRHFVFRNSDERYILKEDSAVRTRGAELGLPAMYLEWLCGDDESVTASEQGIYLTPRFFQELE